MFFWSDSWLIENNTALFMPGETCDSLYEYDFDKKICKYLVEIPGEDDFRRYSHIIRHEKSIFMIPDRSKEILVYDENSNKFKIIEIENHDNVRLLFTSYYTIDGYKLYIYSYGLQKLLVVDMNLCSIIEEIKISDGKKDIISMIKVGNSFFGASRIDGNVYEVNYRNRIEKVHIIDNIERLNLICYDGDKFWLSGYEKKIYYWNLGDKKAYKLGNFPESFGFCKENGVDKTSVQDGEIPVFLCCFCANENVFFIPFTGNQILYVNNKNKEIQIVESLYDSNNVDEFFDFRMNSVFLKQYIKEDRYIGLYWLKKNKQLEYDTFTGKWYEIHCEYDISKLEKDKRIYLREEEYGLCGFIEALTVWNE